MSNSRCLRSRGITSEFALSEPLSTKKIFYNSFESLDASAQKGCDFCALLFQHLVYRGCRYEDKGQITLELCYKNRRFFGINLPSLWSALKFCSGECRKVPGSVKPVVTVKSMVAVPYCFWLII